MRRTILLTIVLLGALAPAAKAQEPVIPAGVSAAGIDVSNLPLSEATNRIAYVFTQKLNSPLSTHAADLRWLLRPKQVNFKFDPAKTARRAYNAGIAPHTGNVDVPVYVSFSTKKVQAYVDKIAKRLARAPVDARVDITLRHIRKVPGREGRALNAKALAKDVAATLGNPLAERKLRPKLLFPKPKIGTAELSKAYGTIITIDRANFTLRLFKRLKVAKTYRVAVGMPAYPTPTGRFSITNKAVNPTWTAPDSPWAGAYRNEVVAGGSAENPLKARWMGIVNGVGIHGTGIPGSIGSAASHGCIRMTVPDVIDLYPRVPVGTPVLIGN
jgi:lipoprotein-anchoring transpeptidase ErfK/SrfK